MDNHNKHCSLHPRSFNDYSKGADIFDGEKAQAAEKSEVEKMDSPVERITSILSERGTRYGVFAENAAIAEEIESCCRKGRNWHYLAPDQRLAIKLIAGKLSRLLTGDPDYLDNWDDIQGYAKLVSDRLRKKNDKPNQT